jgi:ParB-like chromosome segregation protein Spo0J
MKSPEPHGKVHQVAEMFPLMPDDELDELAADIKENGLNQPITLDSEGALIDGRNRLEACRQAGVKPTFRTLNGQDPIAFIISSNVRRRHLSKGQQAMAVAKASNLVSNLGHIKDREGKKSKLAEATGTHRTFKTTSSLCGSRRVWSSSPSRIIMAAATMYCSILSYPS